jgi:tetratricopeptide (TPR) repeat protein
VWRAGANENTVITFSDPVTIEGKALERGAYGLFMIPTENEWTIIFSKNSTSWGAFTYDQKEDALRVTVKPQTSELHNALAYDFEDLKPDFTLVTLRWEKVAVPFKVAVDVPHLVQASLDKQLRSLSQYTWMSWDEAANYYLDNKLDSLQALKYADTSIQNEERFENMVTKSKALERLDKKDEATAVRNKAFERGTALQVHMYARGLQNDKRQDEAFAIFRSNAQKNPNAWVVHTGMARVYSGSGDFDNAVKEMKLAADGAPDKAQKTYLETLVRRLEAKEDINK